MTALPFTGTVSPTAPQDRDGSVDAAGFATFPLADSPRTPTTAREATRTTLFGWGLGALIDDALVVVSELVTNALRYGLPQTPSPRPLPPASPEQPLLLSLLHCGSAVLCAVFDPGQEVPRRKEPDFFAESGRGLHVLESLAADWGFTTPDRHGKAVWALLTDPTDAATPAGPEERDDWEPLTRLLLLLELLNGPSWLKALGASAPRTAAGRSPR